MMRSLDPIDGLPPVSASLLPDITALDGNRKEPKEASLPERIGSYRLLGFVGEGGMGLVYRAAQDNPPRDVALKIVNPDRTTPEKLKRFEHEAKILARLQHPGIAQIFEAGVAKTSNGPQPFFAMELIHGSKLKEFVRERKLGTRDVLNLVVGVCRSIQHAHQR